jgi:heptose I phosphotransferase
MSIGLLASISQLFGYEWAVLDDGRVYIAKRCQEPFQGVQLDTFEAFWKIRLTEVAREVGERQTSRIELVLGGDRRAFYLKRHGRPHWKEWLKPLLRLTWPVLGAIPEWKAIAHFENAGIPTMVGVACGWQGGRSFLLTESLEGYIRADHWMEQADDRLQRKSLVTQVAEMVARMHASGLHHQDLYLCHLLLKWGTGDPGGCDARLIDLGRVRKHRRLPLRWRIKDLAQLYYSSCRLASTIEMMRFWRSYWNAAGVRRSLATRKWERTLIKRIVSKAHRIDRHTRKNDL